MSSNKNIPQLRFPEFNGEWEEKPLSSFLHEHKTKSDGKCEVHSVSVTKGVVNQVEYLGRSFAAADTSKYNLVKPNDIIYTKSPTGAFPYGIVKQNKNPYNVIVSPLYAVYSPINKYVGYILDSYFESPERTNNYLSSLIQKGAKNTINITNDTFISKCMCLPSDPAEQQKIAECLSEIDNIIAAQGDKVEALKEKKRGLMQQMFPQKGETTPRLRFPGFTGEWDFVNGDELFEPISNKNHNSDLPILALTQEQGAVPRDLINYNVIVSDKSVAGYKVVEVDDFIISLRSFQGGIEYSRYKGLCSPAYIVLRKKSKELCSDFYRIYFKSFNYIQELNKNLEGIRDGKMISYKQFSEIKLPKPSSAEQQKIAECLSTMDDVIAYESAKMEALKNHKKGLMQQLFPLPNK